MWQDPRPEWTSQSGRIVQIGDAAHTFLPSSGNGGTQAMEDAISLASCLDLCGGKARVPHATRVHNLLRFERVSYLQAMGFGNREKQETKADAQKSPVTPGFIRIPLWVVDHDPEQYAVHNFWAALAHLQDGTEFKNTNVPLELTYWPWTMETLLAERGAGRHTILDDLANAE